MDATSASTGNLRAKGQTDSQDDGGRATLR